jgi:hypothetical protein
MDLEKISKNNLFVEKKQKVNYNCNHYYFMKNLDQERQPGQCMTICIILHIANWQQFSSRVKQNFFHNFQLSLWDYTNLEKKRNISLHSKLIYFVNVIMAYNVANRNIK